jgi:hypothetical protein
MRANLDDVNAIELITAHKPGLRSMIQHDKSHQVQDGACDSAGLVHDVAQETWRNREGFSFAALDIGHRPGAKAARLYDFALQHANIRMSLVPDDIRKKPVDCGRRSLQRLREGTPVEEQHAGYVVAQVRAARCLENIMDSDRNFRSLSMEKAPAAINDPDELMGTCNSVLHGISSSDVIPPNDVTLKLGINQCDNVCGIADPETEQHIRQGRPS